MEATPRPVKLLRGLLRREGAAAFGVAPAKPVDDPDWDIFEGWLARGMHAGMVYMENYPDIRRDPRLLLEGARSVISVAFNYRQTNPLAGVVATYALGRDYHKVLRRRLKTVVKGMEESCGGRWRICIDSAPVLERYWAVKAGVGWRSPVHGNVVVPGVGSMVFLAEIITTLELPPVSVNFYGGDAPSEPGRQVCPTGALQPSGMVEASVCINYLTIEHKGELTAAQLAMKGAAFFGCDLCQRVCPENSGPSAPVIPEFLPLEGLEDFVKGNPGAAIPLRESPLGRRFKQGKIPY